MARLDEEAVRRRRAAVAQLGEQRAPQRGLPALVVARGVADPARRAVAREHGLAGLPRGEPLGTIGQVMVEHGRDAVGKLVAHRIVGRGQIRGQPRRREPRRTVGCLREQAVAAPHEAVGCERRTRGHRQHAADLRPQPLREIRELDVRAYAVARGDVELEATAQRRARHDDLLRRPRAVAGRERGQILEQRVGQRFVTVRIEEMEHEAGVGTSRGQGRANRITKDSKWTASANLGRKARFCGPRNTIDSSPVNTPPRASSSAIQSIDALFGRNQKVFLQPVLFRRPADRGRRFAAGRAVPDRVSQPRARLHDLDRRARRLRRRHAGPAQVQAQRNARVQRDRLSGRARDRPCHTEHLRAVAHHRAAHLRAVADRRLRQPLAADQLRDAVHDGDDARGEVHAAAGVHQRRLDSRGRPLVHVLGHARVAMAGAPDRAAGAGREPVRLRRLPARARAVLRPRCRSRRVLPQSRRQADHGGRNPGNRARHRAAQPAEATPRQARSRPHDDVQPVHQQRRPARTVRRRAHRLPAGAQHVRRLGPDHLLSRPDRQAAADLEEIGLAVLENRARIRGSA